MNTIVTQYREHFRRLAGSHVFFCIENDSFSRAAHVDPRSDGVLFRHRPAIDRSGLIDPGDRDVRKIWNQPDVPAGQVEQDACIEDIHDANVSKAFVTDPVPGGEHLPERLQGVGRRYGPPVRPAGNESVVFFIVVGQVQVERRTMLDRHDSSRPVTAGVYPALRH